MQINIISSFCEVVFVWLLVVAFLRGIPFSYEQKKCGCSKGQELAPLAAGVYWLVDDGVSI